MIGPRPRGPRGGDADTRADILAAADTVFVRDGYERGSFRAVAREAGVDPALVHHYFGSKAELFLEALRPMTASALAETPIFDGPPEEAGVRLVRVFLSLWDDPHRGVRLRTILMGAAVSEDVARVVRALLVGEVLPLAVPADADQRELRVAACASQLVGIAIGRHIVQFPPLVSADGPALERLYGPTLQHYMTGPLEL